MTIHDNEQHIQNQLMSSQLSLPQNMDDIPLFLSRTVQLCIYNSVSYIVEGHSLLLPFTLTNISVPFVNADMFLWPCVRHPFQFTVSNRLVTI